MIRYIVVALVPQPFRDTIAQLRREHDSFTRQWLPPHITVIPPFNFPLTRQEINAIRSLKLSETPTFDGYGEIRRPETSILLLELKDHGFQRMQDAVTTAVPALQEFVEQHPHPHVTVVSRIPNDRFEEVQSKATATDIDGSFSIKQLTLYQWDDEVRRWIEVTG